MFIPAPNNVLVCSKCGYLWNPSLSLDECHQCKEPARVEEENPNPITVLAWRIKFHNRMVGRIDFPKPGTRHDCLFCDREEAKGITTYTYAYETGSLILWICMDCLRAGRHVPHRN